MNNDLDPDDEDSLSAIEHCIVSGGKRVHFTQVGLARYAERFGRAGINIRAIKTRAQLLEAIEASFPMEWDKQVARIALRRPRSHRERIERECLVAIALGDKDQARRSRAAIERLDTRPLVLVRPE